VRRKQRFEWSRDAQNKRKAYKRGGARARERERERKEKERINVRVLRTCAHLLLKILAPLATSPSGMVQGAASRDMITAGSAGLAMLALVLVMVSATSSGWFRWWLRE
jgi:hypothetical protein